LVQTGLEPGIEGIWSGVNLRTAFISLGKETFEDALVISRSASEKLGDDRAVEKGDKLSNRHGTKGVVSRVRSDDEMPRLKDGTPLELICCFIGLHTRMNMGLLREAVMGTIALKRGEPVIAPPFEGPSDEEMKAALKEEGLPESGMTEIYSADGALISPAAAAGPVYWGLTHHITRNKIHMSVGPSRCQRLLVNEYEALIEAKAYECLREFLTVTTVLRSDAAEFADSLGAGAPATGAPAAEVPSPLFNILKSRLAAAGIAMKYENGEVGFRLSRPEGGKIQLAESLPHPWLRDEKLEEIGSGEEGCEVEGLLAKWEVPVLNERCRRLINDNAPQSLQRRSLGILAEAVGRFFADLVKPELLQLGSLETSRRIMFSGRTVAIPGLNLTVDQVGLPEEMAWTLFSPFLRGLISEKEIEGRTARAVGELDNLMSRWWVIVNRAPTISLTSFIAFQPVRIDGDALALHPLICRWMNADFDGDQVAVFVPVGEAAREEARKRLSVSGHLDRDPGLVRSLIPPMESLWGLAHTGLSEEGRKEIERIAGRQLSLHAEYLTAEMLADDCEEILAREDAGKTLSILESLADFGFKKTVEAGPSMTPFMANVLELPPKPENDSPEEWEKFRAEAESIIRETSDLSACSAGAQILAVLSGARGSVGQLIRLTCWAGNKRGVRLIHPVRHGQAEGLNFDEFVSSAFDVRETIHSIVREILSRDGKAAVPLEGDNSVFARARLSSHPGIVFARAARKGDRDPLRDPRTRLFVGLHPTEI
jgi:hypothetical protein